MVGLRVQDKKGSGAEHTLSSLYYIVYNNGREIADPHWWTNGKAYPFHSTTMDQFLASVGSMTPLPAGEREELMNVVPMYSVHTDPNEPR